MLALIKEIAEKDERIRAVLMTGSRADRECPIDRYQDFDIVYFVRDVKPFWDNMPWIEANFGKPSLVQKPESMKLIPPDDNGDYVYLMIFPDGNRIDLSISSKPYISDGEPAILLLDKDGTFPEFTVDEGHWHVKPPTASEFADCANEFHWCLNNAAKGIARDELSYVMTMLHSYVRDMLVKMLTWFIGARFDFKVSAGKLGKYFKKYLPVDMYRRFEKTYPDADYQHIWASAFEMLDLFRDAALYTAEILKFTYDFAEEDGIRQYMLQVKEQWEKEKK